MIRDSNENGEAEDALRVRLLSLEDGLSRLKALCHFGGLAADGMHGLGQNLDASALASYFTLLGAEIGKMQLTCREGRGSPETD